MAFLGLFGSPNFGNEATLAAFMHHVKARLPQVEFVGVAPRRSTLTQEHGIRLIDIDPYHTGSHFWRLRPVALRDTVENLARRATEGRRRALAIEQLRGADCLVIPGTGVIDDFGQGPLDLPTDLDRWTRAAATLGLPVAFLSVGVSTIRQPSCATLFRRALARADYVSFRDRRSADNAHRHRLTGVDRVVPDLAFSLPPVTVPDAPAANATPVVGLGLMGYRGWNETAAAAEATFRRYLERVSALAAGLLDRGVEVHLLTGDVRADNAVVPLVVDACRQRGAAVDRLRTPPMDDFRSVLRALARTDIVVATRFHNVLLALMMARPAVSIAYSDKNDAVMEQFGLQAYCHEIDRFEPDAVLTQVELLLANPAAMRAGLQREVAAARVLLDAQYDELCAAWTGAAQPTRAGAGSPTG